MPERNNLKKAVKEPVKNLVKEVVGNIVYRITKAGTKKAINELKQELKKKSIHRLQRKLESLSEQQLDKRLKEISDRLTREITQEAAQREELIRDIEQGFRQGLKEKLLTLAKAPVLKIAVVTTVCVIVAGAGTYVGVKAAMGPGQENEPHPAPRPTDTTSPEVIVRLLPQRPGPGQMVTFTVEAVDNVGVELIELLVNGELVKRSESSPLVFTGGPYAEGSTVIYRAYAYDGAGNRGSSGERSFRIPPSVEPVDNIAPKVMVGHAPPEPQPGQRVTFTVEAEDNVGIELIELRVNGELVERSASSPLVFTGGPYAEGSTVIYSAYAWDGTGNRGMSGERSFRIPPPAGPVDNIAPKVGAGHNPPQPQPGQIVTFTIEAEDNVGIELIELRVNGEVVAKSESSPLVFTGGPYAEGSTVIYSAYAYDGAGNRGWSGEYSFSIPVPEKHPDLVVTSFQVTGPLRTEGDNVYAPVRVVVRNQGNAAAAIFKVSVERQKAGEPYYVRPFTVPGQASSWYPYTGGPLPAGGEVAFEGDVVIGPTVDFVGLTVALRVTADSCLGDEFQPDYCRVQESNEDNNQYSISVKVPIFKK